MTEDQFLNTEDLRQLDVANLEYKLREQEIAKLRLQIELLRAQKETITSKVLLAEHELVTKSNTHKNKIGNHKKWMSELRERYSVGEKDSFAHDPISGKLHITRSK